MLGVFNPAVKKLGYEAGHLLPFSVAVKNEGSLFPLLSQRGVQGVQLYLLSFVQDDS